MTDPFAEDFELPAPHKRICVTFVETMLAILPYMNTEYQTFSHYFRVIQDFASLSGDHTSFLVQRGTIAQLADFLCQDKTPKRHPKNGQTLRL